MRARDFTLRCAVVGSLVGIAIILIADAVTPGDPPESHRWALPLFGAILGQTIKRILDNRRPPRV